MTNTDNRPTVSEVTPLDVIGAADALLAAFVKHRTSTHTLGKTREGQAPCITCGETDQAMLEYRIARRALDAQPATEQARDAEVAAWEKWAEHVESLVVHLYKVGLVGTDGSCAACVDIIAILDSAYGQPATVRTVCPTCSGQGTVVER